MADTPKAILLIADISGYTRFMRQHAIATSHAKQIVVRLLKALMQASRPPLKVAELEGDAVFFYALSSESNASAVADQVKSQMVQFFTAFYKEIDTINQVKTCSCDACDCVGDLKLKQVVHCGDVGIERIAQFEKLFGIDVILVHRMLKNSVPSKEYVMMTDPIFSFMKGFFGLEPERRKENFEGVGEVETLVFYPADVIEKNQREQRIPGRGSMMSKALWRIRITFTTIMELQGWKKFKGVFRNLPA